MPPIAMPEVNGALFINEEAIDVHWRPVLDESDTWAVCNFSRRHALDRVFLDRGPHIKIYPSGLGFLQLLDWEKEVTSVDKAAPTLFGTIRFLTGRLACDRPSTQCFLEAMTLRATRLSAMTRFSFSAMTGQCSDHGGTPPKLAIRFSFDIPDHTIEAFIPNEDERKFYVSLIQQKDQTQ